ncbi:MAG: hypothetical protein D6765_05780 [Bacteroidetes bacterium]|nr:MAG: hypothetical protein D6765_05780 [Bacteroidota bacterium]
MEVHYDTLLLLGRIPWLQQGQWPEKLRRQFLEELRPEEEQAAREAVLRELEAAGRLIEQGAAAQELTAQVALQKFSINPFEQANATEVLRLKSWRMFDRRSLSELQHSLQRRYHPPETQDRPWYQEESPESNVFEKAQMANVFASSKAEFLRPAPPLDEFLSSYHTEPEAPEPLPRPVFTRDFYLACVSSLLLLMLGVFTFLFDGSPELYRWVYGEEPTSSVSHAERLPRKGILFQEKILADSAVLYNNAAVEQWENPRILEPLAGGPSKGMETYSALSFQEARRFLRRALELRPDYTLAESNLAHLLYDEGARYFNRFMKDSLPAEVLPEVRRLFAEAARYDTARSDALHGLGLLHYYQNERDSALLLLEEIQKDNPAFFDTLRLRPNLLTLLQPYGAFQSAEEAALYQKLRDLLVGVHPITLQWISWDEPGLAKIVEEEPGLFYIAGEQRGQGKQKDDYLRIEGLLEIVDERTLRLVKGEVVTRVSHNNYGRPCVKTAPLTFRASGTRQYWRMQEMVNCEGGRLVDYVDIYFDKIQDSSQLTLPPPIQQRQ